MARRQEPHERGLPSINRARQERQRALVLGKARIYGGSPQFWTWTFLGLSAFVVLYWKYAQGELESQKSGVLATQRAVAQSLGPKILPFVDQVERWAIELGRDGAPDFVEPGTSLERITRGPGVYLRLRKAFAVDRRSIRDAAARSLRDGFTSCLFVREEAGEGKACKTSTDCGAGELCNERTVCARPSQPFNMRLAYRALKVLEPEWTDELHQAGTDLAVRAFELDLESVIKNDVPIAAELLARARYVTVVLDDDPEGGLPPAAPARPGTALSPESDEERLQRVPHRATVGIWDLQQGKPLLRTRSLAAASVLPMGEQGALSETVRAAQSRQVNSCALALHVRELLAESERP